jgi:hypothetical protein
MSYSAINGAAAVGCGTRDSALNAAAVAAADGLEGDLDMTETAEAVVEAEQILIEESKRAISHITNQASVFSLPDQGQAIHFSFLYVGWIDIDSETEGWCGAQSN